jgi:hypothetical protein
VVAAHQQITHAWWATKDKFELYVSEAVLAEAGAGDPIVDEVRAIRDEYAKSLGYDLEAIVADLRSRQEQHPERVVSLPPKRVTK